MLNETSNKGPPPNSETYVPPKIDLLSSESPLKTGFIMAPLMIVQPQ